MEENNNLLLCCVKDLFGGCGPLPNTPALRFMIAAVMQKDTDGCFSLKTSPVLESFDIVDCNNTISTVQSSGVVIEGVTAPIPVCIQGEKDFAEVYKCDANTGNTILIRTVLDHDTNTYVTTYYDLVVGADWAGSPATDLTECTSNALESDQVIGCDGGVQVVQWIVKDNGEPTGVVYYTDISGAIVTPVAWTPGECPVAEVTRTVDVIDDCAGATTTETVADRIQEVIINGSEKPIDVRIKESCVTESRVDVEYFKFCDDGNTNANFIRRVERTYSVAGALLSETIVDTETDLTTPYVVVGNAVVCQPENPVDFEQRCVQDSSLTPIKGIELRERLADGTYAVVGYVESDGVTAWTPVAPVTDCVDTFARTSCASSAPASVTIQGNINFTDVGGGLNPGMTDAAPFLTTPADANALDGVSTQLNIPLTTIDALNFQDGEQYLYITSNGGVSSPMATQWVEATDPTGSTFATDLTNELISVLPSINVNAVPTVTITSVVSPILNYDLQFVYGPSADTVDTVNSTGNTHSIDANNQTQINWDFVLPFTPTISDTLVSVTFEYAGSQSSVMNFDGAVIAGGLIGTNYGTLSNPTPYVFAPALGAGTVQTVSYSMTAAIDGITWADIATKFSGWAYMGQSENIQMLVDGMQVTVNYTTEGAPEDAYKTTGCNDDRRDGFLETLATTSLTTTNTLRSESHNYVQLDSFGNYTGNLVTETRTYNNDGSLNSVVYTDTVNGSVVSLNGSTTQLAPVTGSDFESIIMCDGTETFIRTIGYMPGGDITFTNDRLADGTAYTPVGPVTIGSCDTGSVTNLTKTVQRLAAPYVVVTNYSSATITSISADVTIDGVSIPAGFTWSVDSSTNQIFTDTVSITGTDYIVTEVR